MALCLRVPEWVKWRVGEDQRQGARSVRLSKQLSHHQSHVEERRPRGDGSAGMQLWSESMPDDPKTQAFLWPTGAGRRSGQRRPHRADDRRPEQRRVSGPRGLSRASVAESECACTACRAASSISPPSKRQAPIRFPWIKPGDKPLTFHTTGQEKNVTLVPINTLFDKRYSVYWQVS